MKAYNCVELGMFTQHASNFTTMEAIYEIVKNAEEGNDGIRASHISVHVQPKDKIMFIVGNGGGLDEKELTEEFMTIGKSFKDERHKGSGRISFLRFATRMVFISKKNGIHYIVDCLPQGEKIVAEIEPRKMTGTDESQYMLFTRHLGRFQNGSIAVFEHVGDPLGVRGGFKVEEEIEKKAMVKELQNKFRNYLRQKHALIVKYGDDRGISLKFDPGKGKELTFSCPSKDCKGCEGRDRCNNRNIFTHEIDGKRYQYSLYIDFDLRLTATKTVEEDIYIHEEGQNARSVSEVFSRAITLRGSRVYFNKDLGQYLHGGIDFSVTALDGGPMLDLYTGDRTLNLGGSFAGFRDCLSNMLIQAEFNKIRPAIIGFIGARNKTKDDKEGELLTEELTFLWRNERDSLSSDFPEIFSSRNLGVVPVREITCPNCKIRKEPRRITLSQDQEVPRGGIFIVGQVYKCGNCGAEWGGKRSETERPVPGTPLSTPPIYEAPQEGHASKPRERKHGFGYTFQVGADRIDEKRRWYQRSNTDIVINAAHPDFKKFKDIAREHKNVKILRAYQRMIAVHALIQLHYSDVTKFRTVEVLEKLEKLQARVLMNFYTFGGKGKLPLDALGDDEFIPENTPVTEIRPVPPPLPKESTASMAERLKKGWGVK